MKYLVTGGAGFIGSHLVDALHDAGHIVQVIDDLSAGNLNHLEKIRPRVGICVPCDIANMDTLMKCHGLFKDCDGIFHLAAEARIQPSIKHPRACMQTNVMGTLNILEIAKLFNINNIVYSASSSSYGLKNKPPLRECMTPDPLNPYAVSKLMGEQLIQTWGKCYGVKNASLKYFNVYGPRSPLHIGAYSPVIGLFFKQVLEAKGPITVVGPGSQTRDFTYVDDVVNANIAAMHDLQHDANSNGLTINIGTGKAITILELAKKVRAALGVSEYPIQHIEARPGECDATLADISLAKRILNWQPMTSLEQALESLAKYYFNKILPL